MLNQVRENPTLPPYNLAYDMPKETPTARISKMKQIRIKTAVYQDLATACASLWRQYGNCLIRTS
ncbi:hypothetical protein OS493_015704 [Desmophyllum pertusum]|uniref:Uncharacterized protein n=1 Tax=Desmophyllum pertusum TaxID=174260 RepID=A0A9X0CKV1_9CNID|nr:hypothetical protein OS493_015704 [Desmophyllum pertusum]